MTIWSGKSTGYGSSPENHASIGGSHDTPKNATRAWPATRPAKNADKLLRRYCTLIYAETHSYQETARRLALDRRTVKDKVDPELLARLESETR